MAGQEIVIYVPAGIIHVHSQRRVCIFWRGFSNRTFYIENNRLKWERKCEGKTGSDNTLLAIWSPARIAQTVSFIELFIGQTVGLNRDSSSKFELMRRFELKYPYFMQSVLIRFTSRFDELL